MAVSTFSKNVAARRRTADINRLIEQYQKGIGSVTSEYESAFEKYKTGVSAQMAPFESAMAQYKQTAMPEYERQASAYQQALSDYQKQLDAIAADPVSPVTVRQQTGRTWYGKPKFSDVTYWVPKELPTFSAQEPTLPGAPKAPEIAPFGSGEFDAKRGQVESEFKRELGERRSARLSAVSRRSSRPLMQGA